ncbi:hypothetical protein [Paenibacillus harenae]|uniref:DnaD domain protein n=1 Tax=Paenibacillus harenae TaxID=306543 RepID=A0ABT9U188_PAEHA|nr:hypothetical protein [Paenibacillus harenae]MDQ0061766.1 hypothetical protein [Paenibacillus harenae]MDQ0113389.1 hypothetical protein [Paenibacillus harenae]
MTNEMKQIDVRNFTVSTEIFFKPDLDIYSQMIYIVLSSRTSEASSLTLSEISRKGRMTVKQAIKAMQTLVDQQLIPHKLFRQMIGEFQDDRLSWAAKGLLTYCKEHREISLQELLALSDQSGEDEQSIRKALLELALTGYLEEFPELRKLAT